MKNSDIIEIKQIKDFENYTINILGEIKNIKTGNILKQSIDGKGYYKIKLSQNNIKKTLNIHRLLAQHFIPNPENKAIVDHKDNNIKNNSIDNLRWCSRQQNAQNSVKQKNTSSIYKGVFWSIKNKKWITYLHINKKIYLGSFTTEEDAGKAYDKYIIEHNLQEYFKLNF